MMRPRYIVQVKVKKGARWEPIESFEEKGDAINTCAKMNRGYRGGTAVHRVFDAVNGEEVYLRGWLDP